MNDTRNDTTDAIVALEWEAFRNVRNEGGRASCQDDFPTFRIMRESQFSVWPETVRQSYLADLKNARQTGRNLPEEKYARMMAVTAPEAYAALAPRLPPLSPETLRLAGEILDILTGWQRDFAAACPFLASGGRPVEENRPGATSFAAYMMGELLTYSPKTLALLAAYVRDLQGRGENLSLMTMERMVARHGYSSLTEAETAHRQRSGQSG